MTSSDMAVSFTIGLCVICWGSCGFCVCCVGDGSDGVGAFKAFFLFIQLARVSGCALDLLASTKEASGVLPAAASPLLSSKHRCTPTHRRACMQGSSGRLCCRGFTGLLETEIRGAPCVPNQYACHTCNNQLCTAAGTEPDNPLGGVGMIMLATGAAIMYSGMTTFNSGSMPHMCDRVPYSNL